MRLSAWLCVLIWLPAYILCGCALKCKNPSDEIEKARKKFDETSTIVVNVDFIPQKAHYYDKLKAIYSELNDLKINPKRVCAKCEQIKKQCREIDVQVQQDLIKTFEQKIERIEPDKNNDRHVQYLNEILKILNKPTLDPYELAQTVVDYQKAEKQKTDVLMNISFGAGDHQLNDKGQTHLKTFYGNNVELVIAQVSEEDVDIPLLLQFSFEILGYTDEIGFSAESTKKLGKQCDISFESSQKENRKKLNRCLSKLRAAAVGEYFRELKTNSDAKGGNKMVKTNFIIKPVGKGEEMPDGLKDARPRDERRRICKIIFTYWKEVQTE